MSLTVTIAFSTEQRRPGCVIVQAAMGATIANTELERWFPAETWLLAPTDDMQVYQVTFDQMKQLAEMAKRAIDPTVDITKRPQVFSY